LTQVLDARQRKEKMSRRQFIKTGLMSLGSLYFGGLEILNQFLSVVQKDQFNEGSLGRKIERSVQTPEEKFHPEIYGLIVTLRNELWAHKLDCVAKELKERLGYKPKIAVVVGSAHHGLEDTLQENPQERLETIQRFFNAFKIAGLAKETKINQTLKFEYSPEKQRWELTEKIIDPLLKKIEE